MPSDYEKLMNMLHPISWTEWFYQKIVAIVLFSLSVILNASLGLLLGALIGWLFSGWFSEGLGMFHIQSQPSKLYKLTALIGLVVGYISAFVKYPLLIKFGPSE